MNAMQKFLSELFPKSWKAVSESENDEAVKAFELEADALRTKLEAAENDVATMAGELINLKSSLLKAGEALEAFGKTEEERSATIEAAQNWNAKQGRLAELEAWHANMKEAGIGAAADESDRSNDAPKRVSKVTQEAINAKQRREATLATVKK